MTMRRAIWIKTVRALGQTSHKIETDTSLGTVMMMEAQIQSLHSALSALKKKPKKDKKNKSYGAPKPSKAPRPATSSSFSGVPKKKKKQSHDDDEVLTFEQKKALSESIQTLDGAKLEKVLEIIDEVYPEIREVCTSLLSRSNRHITSLYSPLKKSSLTSTRYLRTSLLSSTTLSSDRTNHALVDHRTARPPQGRTLSLA